MSKDPFDGIDIPKEAKTKLERKLVELNFRMNGDLTDENRREFVIFSLAIDNTVPEFLRKLLEKEREYAILQAKKLGYYTNSSSASENDVRVSVHTETTSENYKIVYDAPLPVLRSILKKSSGDDSGKIRKKHKKLKKVKFDLPDEENDRRDTEINNDNSNVDQQSIKSSSSSKVSSRSTSSTKRSSRHKSDADKNARSNHNLTKKLEKNYKTVQYS